MWLIIHAGIELNPINRCSSIMASDHAAML